MSNSSLLKSSKRIAGSFHNLIVSSWSLQASVVQDSDSWLTTLSGFVRLIKRSRSLFPTEIFYIALRTSWETLVKNVLCSWIYVEQSKHCMIVLCHACNLRTSVSRSWLSLTFTVLTSKLLTEDFNHSRLETGMAVVLSNLLRLWVILRSGSW